MKRIQSVVLAAVLLQLAACGGGGGGGTRPEPPDNPPPPRLTAADPDYHLQSERFTTHQPQVLEQIGAHHAYAKGLTGRGIRIAIEDTIVDYTQHGEFDNRVRLTDADGASLIYWRPPGRENSYDAARCASDPANCRVLRINSQGDGDAYNRAVRNIVAETGWPEHDDSYYIIDEYYSASDPIGRLYVAWEMPTVYNEGNHGTAVASTAAGKTLGVAPQASIIPVATNLTDDQSDESLIAGEILSLVASLPTQERARFDEVLANQQRDDYRDFDIINRSFGPTNAPDWLQDTADANSADQFLRQVLPRFRDAFVQKDRSAAERTIIVYAAGNESHPRPDWEAALPYYIPDARGHQLAVVATDPQTRQIAGYSDSCGPLPGDWSASLHGPHFCLAAPGTVRGLVPDAVWPGRGVVENVGGTSFAAPVVSGALALMMEHFRGTRGNTAVVRRMLDTADRTGEYARSDIYGAGHLDLEAALSPVGTLTAGQSQRALAHTSLQTPGAFGSVAERAGNAEVATFDAQGFPFWTPVASLVSSRSTSRSPIPAVEARGNGVTPAAGLETLGAHWFGLGQPARSPVDTREWVAGFAPGAATIARREIGGWEHGFSFENGGYLGARPSGAFGSNLHSGMFWTSHSFERELGTHLTLDASATIAASLPRYESDAIFEASPSLLSALSVRVGTEETGLTLEQPLRAESGTGTFRLETGWMEDGRRLHAEHRVALRPEAREVRATLRHERDAAGGQLALELSDAINAGHVAGNHDASVGLAWRTMW